MNNAIKTGSEATIAILVIAMIIFGAPFLLISVWDSVEHEVPYQVMKIKDNDGMEGCSSDFVTVLGKPDNGITIEKCGKLGKLNQIVFILEGDQEDDE